MSRNSAMPEALTQSLRAAATRAGEIAGGGYALVFAADPGAPEGQSPPLRAAAGFSGAEAARSAATGLAGAVADCLGQARMSTCTTPEALSSNAAAGMAVLPLTCSGRVRGVLAIGLATPLEPQSSRLLGQIALNLGLQLDHMQLCHEVELLRAQDRSSDAASDESGEDSDELLKLSEQLFAQDIELLRRDEKLGKIEKLKNDFIEKMSRELRTPLNSIIEGIISVLTGENDTLSDDAKQTLRSALDDGSAFLRTLQNILDLWRIKQNELPVEVHDMNFREMVEEAIFSIQDAIGDKPIAVEQHILEPFPKIRTDLTKVNQILFLLLDNAAKFTPEGRIEIRASVEDEELVCEVRDTGVGICPDDQQFIFEEFFQVDVASSQTYSGAGLGLALVKDLVTLLDGQVAVSSDVGRGTSVSLRIPVQVVR